MTRTQITQMTDDSLVELMMKAARLITRFAKQKGVTPTTRRTVQEAKAQIEVIKAEIALRSYRQKLDAKGQQLLVERKSPWCWGDSRMKPSCTRND